MSALLTRIRAWIGQPTPRDRVVATLPVVALLVVIGVWGPRVPPGWRLPVLVVSLLLAATAHLLVLRALTARRRG